jgi:MFS family permease
MNTSQRTTYERREVFGLGLLFGAIYFAQGISEPTEGLIAQPVRSLLNSWGRSPTSIALFGAILSLPWSLKPLYGLLTDFVPLGGTHRRSYLLLTSAAAAGTLCWLYAYPPLPDAYISMLLILLISTMAVAFSDVVVDALMVETGQPRGMTGRLQSIQWAAMNGATLFTGVIGGYLSQQDQQHVGFLLAATAAALTLVLTLVFVRENPTPQSLDRRQTCNLLWMTAATPGLWASAAFLFLWNFNPFNTAVLQLHMTGPLMMSEQFYGTTVSLLAAASMVASIAYGFYCRTVRFSWLLHASIAGGIISTLAYAWMSGPLSALVVTVCVGFSYMTATLIQLDLAARICLPATAGTTFAALMAVSNLGMIFSLATGGWLYDRWSQQWNPIWAFRSLVILGAATTALCWLLYPTLLRAIRK